MKNVNYELAFLQLRAFLEARIENIKRTTRFEGDEIRIDILQRVIKNMNEFEAENDGR